MPLILGTNSIKDTGYNVDNSLRFNKGSSDYLNKTFGTSTSEGTWTYSVWIKISDPAFIDNHVFFSGGGASDNRTQLYFGETTGTLNIYRSISGSTVNLESDASFRDPSAWYNLCVQNNAGTVAAYINGVAVTLDGSSLGTNVINKSDTVHKIGRGATGTYTSSYMSEIVFIDGTVVAPTGFGEFDDSGIWKPINVSGLTFGDNGFYLEFKQSGTSQNSSGLGADTSGNDNHFAVNNLTAIDQSTDTCTNNFCTPNPLYPGSGVAFSEGNLKTIFTSYTQSPNGTIGAGAGKWYYEMKMSGTHARFGWCESHCPQGDTDSDSTFPAYAIYSNGSSSLGLRVYKNVTNRAITDNGGYTEWSAGNIVGIAFDIDNGKLYAHLNGTYYNSGDPANGTGALITGITAQQGGLFLPYLNCGTDSSRTFEWNFGSPPYSESGGESDADGYGNFAHAVPSGYYVLNSKNLAEYG